LVFLGIGCPVGGLVEPGIADCDPFFGVGAVGKLPDLE